MKEKIKTILIIILFTLLIFLIYFSFFHNKQKNIVVRPEAFYIEKYFLASELYCPENEYEAGRLNRQCYLPVPCYESGARLQSVTCEKSDDMIPPPERPRNYFWDY